MVPMKNSMSTLNMALLSIILTVAHVNPLAFKGHVGLDGRCHCGRQRHGQPWQAEELQAVCPLLSASGAGLQILTKRTLANHISIHNHLCKNYLCRYDMYIQ